MDAAAARVVRADSLYAPAALSSPLRAYGAVERPRPWTPQPALEVLPGAFPDGGTSTLEAAPGAPPQAPSALARAPARGGVPCASLRSAMLPAGIVALGSALGMLPAGVQLAAAPGRKLRQRVFTGCTLGVVVSAWIFSGTWAFLSVFGLMAVVAQTEYWRMARANGFYPTWKLGTLGSVGMYVAACTGSERLRDALFPITGTVTLAYLMLRRATGIERATPPLTMNDVSSTFMGIYLFGYMPSFWVRLRCLAPLANSAVLAELLPTGSPAWRWPILRALAASPADFFSLGAVIQWWTMSAIVAADVAAYFVGKRFGRTRLIELSPGKTWEGLLGGAAAAVAWSVFAAVCMSWPRPWLSGAAYGLLLTVMALVGDLTMSLLKRSTGVKDTGTLLPGHGGLLDRIDSYLLVPAPAYFFVTSLLGLTAR